MQGHESQTSLILERYEEEEIWKTISSLWCLIFDHAVAETEEGIQVQSESWELDFKFKYKLGLKFNLNLNWRGNWGAIWKWRSRFET